MRDCSNATMRDRLADLLHDRLPAAERAEVRAHVAACADCRAELEVLARARAVARTPSVDTSRIVAALPPYRRMSPWQRAVHSPQLRVAAAIILLVGGAAISVDFALRQRTDTAVQSVATGGDTPVVGVASVPADTNRRATTPPAQTVRPNGSMELAVGEMFHDLTDADLRALLAELGSLEAVTPLETEIVLPAVSRGGA